MYSGHPMMRLLIWLLAQTTFWAGVSLVCGPILFLRGFRWLQRKRFILDTPRSTIRAASLGLVEVSGKAVGPYTLVAPLSRSDCLYYRVKVQTNPSGDLNNKIQELSAPLFLDDGTGTLMIYPLGAELEMPASSERSDVGKVAVIMMGQSIGNPEFAQEYCIRPGDRIFALGTLRENPWAKKDPIRECTDLSRIGPGFVSQSEADLIRQELCPSLVPGLPAGMGSESAGDFDFHPPVILTKGDGPFVLSTDSQRDVAARLNWRSLLYIWGGPIIALWGLWKILGRVFP